MVVAVVVEDVEVVDVDVVDVVVVVVVEIVVVVVSVTEVVEVVVVTRRKMKMIRSSLFNFIVKQTCRIWCCWNRIFLGTFEKKSMKYRNLFIQN